MLSFTVWSLDLVVRGPLLGTLEINQTVLFCMLSLFGSFLLFGVLAFLWILHIHPLLVESTMYWF